MNLLFIVVRQHIITFAKHTFLKPVSLIFILSKTYHKFSFSVNSDMQEPGEKTEHDPHTFFFF